MYSTECCIRKEKRNTIDNSSFHLSKPEKQQIKPEEDRRNKNIMCYNS